MLNTEREFEHITDPFTIHLAQRVLTDEQVQALSAAAPKDGFKRIEVLDPNHEKQYAMNLLYLQENSEKSPAAADLSPEWTQLLDTLRGSEFFDWLEAGTGLSLRDLPTDIGIYTHNDGDYISVHKDKPNKAITAILYLNPEWPADGGGAYEVRKSSDSKVPPVREIAPTGGQFLAFPPTDHSWHSVSPVTAGNRVTRLTVQLEFWLDGNDRQH